MTGIIQSQMIKQDEWAGCYDAGWKGLITDAAFAHPAKFSRGLIFRIIEHALADGQIQPGGVVVDPFGGVALGALPALMNGLSWVGCELEQKFVDMGAGMDCPGMSKAEWIRFYGRWARVNYQHGFRWCPECAGDAGKIADPYAVPLSAKQKTRRHRIAEIAKSRGRAVSLPDPIPFPELVKVSRMQAGFGQITEPSTDYKRTGQIPHAGPHRYAGNIELFAKFARGGATATLLQGDSRGLASVVAGAAGLVVGSPPFSDNLATNVHTIGFKEITGNMHRKPGATSPSEVKQSYGHTPGQLGAMVVGSPPYAGSMEKSGGIDPVKSDHIGGPHSQMNRSDTRYGASNGQLGAMVVGSPPFAGNTGGRGDASRNGIDAALFDRHGGGMKHGTGSDPANLDNLPQGSISAVVGSPPYEGCDIGAKDKRDGNKRLAALQKAQAAGKILGRESLRVLEKGEFNPNTNLNAMPEGYGKTNGQLGDDTGNTFWQAAKLIIDQCYQILPTNGAAIWVVKNYIKGGREVDFTGQWQALCEACGFETLHIHRAMLVKRRGAQAGFDGEMVSMDVSRKSFFRRLHEAKRPDLAIDWETVLCMVKI